MVDLQVAVAEANRKLDAMVAGMARMAGRFDELEAVGEATVRAMEAFNETQTSMLVELRRLTDAVDKEPPEDGLGDLLRRLTQAVEGNTRAVDALVAMQAQPPAPPAAQGPGPAKP